MPVGQYNNADSAGEARTSAFDMPDVGGAVPARERAMVVESTLAQLPDGLECDRVISFVWSERDGLFCVIAAQGIAGNLDAGIRVPMDRFPGADRVMKTGRTTVADADRAGLPLEIASDFTGEAVICPLTLGDRCIGVCVGRPRAGAHPRSEAWQRRADEVLARAALAVEIHRVSTAYNDELSLRLSTRSIAGVILEGRPLLEIGATIVDAVSARLQEDRVGLFLCDALGKGAAVALRGISWDYASAASGMTHRNPLVRRAENSDGPYLASNVQHDPELDAEQREMYRREEVNSMLIAGLRHGENENGILVIYPRRDRTFSPAELVVVQNFAELSTLAIALGQLLAQQRDVAIVEERNRLAREMHDTVAQTLAGMVLQVETAEMDLAGARIDSVREMLQSLKAQTRSALEDTRRAVQGLSPQSLEAMSLAEALGELLLTLEADDGIVTQFIQTGEERPLTTDQRTALLRIATEAVSNARKHSQAHRVRVGLQFNLDTVNLLIEDDGVGFDTQNRPDPGPEGGYGLFGMNERARLVGGSLEIESTPGWGTRLRGAIPYVMPASADIAPPAPVRAVAMPSDPTSAPVPPSFDEKIRVLIADDHAITRQGIRALLGQAHDITVVGEAADGAQALELSMILHPDVVLMDLQMPGVDGLEGLRRIRTAHPEIPVVILTSFKNDSSVAAALGSGARGYLLKDSEPSELIAGVRAAVRGETLLSAAVSASLGNVARGKAGVGDEAALNEREMEVLRLLAEGNRNKEIAAKLYITSKTVEYHLSHIFMKLGVTNRTEAVRAAMRRGLIGDNLTSST